MTPSSTERNSCRVANPQNFTRRKLFFHSARRVPLLSMCGVIMMLVLGQHSTLFALTPVTEVVVKSGDPAPNKTKAGTFDTITSLPALNNCGSAAFRATLTNLPSSTSGLFLGNGTTRTEVARTKDPAPGGASGDSFGNFGPAAFNGPAVNDADQLLFTSTVFGSRNYHLFRGKPFSRLLDAGQAVPNGTETSFAYLADPGYPGGFSQKGVAAFAADLRDANFNPVGSAIYRTSMPNKLTQIVREGQDVPGGNGKFGPVVVAAFIHPILNEKNEVAFLANLTNTSGGSSDNSGVYRGDGTTLTKIARAGESVPEGGTILNFCCDTAPDMNDAGAVAFRSQNDYPNYPIFPAQAIFKGSGGPLTKIARQGDNIPNNSDKFYSLGGLSRINNAGQVAFLGRIKSSSAVGSGIFRGTTAGSLITIVRDGQNAPGGTSSDKFSNSFLGNGFNASFCLNNAGQVAFTAGVDVDPTNNTPNDDTGIFFFNGSTISNVVRLSDSPATLLGQSFTGAKFIDLQLAATHAASNAPSGVAPAERSGLNDAGQVAYSFTVQYPDNHVAEGVAIWSPTLKLLCAVSRKTHGTGGKKFDIDLPLSGNPLGVECRTGGSGDNYTLVLTFTNKLQTGNASVTTGVGSVSSTTISGNTMTVNLTGVANAQEIVATLSNVTDKAGRALSNPKTVPVGILVGDVDGNTIVENTDVNLVQAQVGKSVKLSNFRRDVNADASITQQDVTITQNHVGTSIP